MTEIFQSWLENKENTINNNIYQLVFHKYGERQEEEYSIE